MSRAASLALAVAVATAVSSNGCAHTRYARVVPLLDSAGVPITSTPAREIPLEVVTSSTSIPDPLPVAGTDLAYADIERALGFSATSAVAEWSAHTTTKRAGGYRLSVELVGARAKFDEGRLNVSFDVRATLSARVGGDYVAQSRGHCQQAALTPAEQGAPVLYACMSQVSRDLSAWLGRLDL